MNNLQIIIKETNETLSITRENIREYFPNEADGTYINLSTKVIAGTKLCELFEEWDQESFNHSNIGLLLSDSGNKLYFYAYEVEYSNDNTGKIQEKTVKYKKYFDVEIFGDILGLCA